MFSTRRKLKYGPSPWLCNLREPSDNLRFEALAGTCQPDNRLIELQWPGYAAGCRGGGGALYLHEKCEGCNARTMLMCVMYPWCPALDNQDQGWGHQTSLFGCLCLSCLPLLAFDYLGLSLLTFVYLCLPFFTFLYLCLLGLGLTVPYQVPWLALLGFILRLRTNIMHGSTTARVQPLTTTRKWPPSSTMGLFSCLVLTEVETIKWRYVQVNTSGHEWIRQKYILS